MKTNYAKLGQEAMARLEGDEALSEALLRSALHNAAVADGAEGPAAADGARPASFDPGMTSEIRLNIAE